ncbi:MAG: glycosyltransferase [bacterium]|nr:glycosyltransferase [bacterium]
MTAVRVLHVDPERAWGGGEVQVLLLCRALAARGVAQTLAVHPDGPLARAAAAAGLPVVPLRIRNDADVVAGLRLRRLARDADVVHFHTARAHALAPLVPRAGRRLVVTRRMDYVPRGGAWARWLYTGAVDAVIAISAGVRDALVRAGVPAERIRIAPSGVDVDAWPPTRAAVRAAWGSKTTPSSSCWWRARARGTTSCSRRRRAPTRGCATRSAGRAAPRPRCGQRRRRSVIASSSRASATTWPRASRRRTSPCCRRVTRASAWRRWRRWRWGGR